MTMLEEALEMECEMVSIGTEELCDVRTESEEATTGSCSLATASSLTSPAVVVMVTMGVASEGGGAFACALVVCTLPGSCA